ncbi:hypothetical protein BC827DRAFT_1237102 [Russula dissimulans]|nr:hypothetical protein BC827DRAFT_1237102 [Russula dissimulans]
MNISMSSTSDEDPLANSNFQAILTTALANYTKQTGNDLLRHPLASKLQTCNSPDSVLVLLQEQAQAFNEFRNGNKRLMTYLAPIVHGLHALSTNAALNKVTALVFQPANLVFSGVAVLLMVAKNVSASYDALVDLFECIEAFLHRLKIYTQVPSTPAMTGIIGKIMIELLSVLGLATKQIKQGRFKKYAKTTAG